MITLFDHELQALVHEDVPYDDLTTQGLRLRGRQATLSFMTRDRPLVVCCTEEIARLSQIYGIEVHAYVQSGTMVPPQSPFFVAHGMIEDIQTIWKVAQNLVDYATGIATHTKELLLLAQKVNPDIVLTTTRKTPPFFKKIAIKAIKAGGATPHRLGLSESLLIFKEHRAFFDDMTDLADAIQHLKRAHPEHKLVIEADTAAEAFSFAALGADILQLEKFRPTELADVVTALKERYPNLRLSATGGVTRDTIAVYTATGVDIIVTSAPYNAPAADIKVVIEPRL